MRNQERINQSSETKSQKKGPSVTIFCVYLLLSLSSAARAGLEDIGAGARAPGMAEAFVAVADDANAIYYNPAGLTQMHASEVTTQSGQFLKGLSDGSSVESNYLGFVHPIKAGRWGTMGLAYQNFKGANFFSDRMLYLSYAWKLKPRAFGWDGQWSAGATVKQFHRQYEPDRYTNNSLDENGMGTGQADPLFAKNGYANEKYALDLGTLYRFGEASQYSAGASITNVDQTDVSLGGDGEKAPMVTRFGLAYHPQWGVLSAELRRAKRLANASDTDMAVGVERILSLQGFGALALRGGYGQGSRGFKTITTGLSFQISKVRLDYSFNFPIGNLSDTSGNHRVALSFQFLAERSPKVQMSNKTPHNPIKLAMATIADAPAPSKTSSSVVAPEEAYASSLNFYLSRKAQGASLQERLALLQNLYMRFSESGVDLAWLSKELSSL
jgi:hypothetical protein